ncbi:hypothetical protein IT399_00825 [Candidatus Nomurabacteria bacterium]|nr:hypothetical protein [Candidatus Nomurabacteria bacterium]
MKSILQFSISKGEKNYIAQAVDFPIFTKSSIYISEKELKEYFYTEN